MTQPAHPPVTTQQFKSKPVAAALALFAGALGAHRLYLGLRLWWLYPLCIPLFVMALQFRNWYQHPTFFVGMLPILIAMAEAIFLALTPDDKWDARFNPNSTRRSDNRWPPVLVAIAGLMIGTTLLMITLVLMFQTYFEAQGLSLG
jgi:hypothetical protein